MILQSKENESNYKYDISFLGYTYKPNIADMRESPAKLIIDSIKNLNFRTFEYDPLVDLKFKERDVLQNLHQSKMIILLVEHESLKEICKKVNYIHWRELI